MYTQFYGLREKPFSLSPDPRYLFLADSHREALAHLLYGIEQGEGFIAITGEVGTGKTTLCRTLLQRIEPGTEVAFIFNPQLSPLELLQAICAELGLEAGSGSRRELTERLNRFLLEKKAEGRRVLLIIDEAQNLAAETLEQIRLLSNLETDTSKLVQIILIGQPELDAILESHQLRQLRQRISVRWRLKPLSTLETRDYVRHRLRIAAGAPRELFSELALREVHRRSRGVPRVVNLLCDRALLAGYAAGARTIGLGIVTQTDREIRGGRSLTRPRDDERPSLARRAAPLAALILLGLFGGFAWQTLRSSSTDSIADSIAPVAEAPAIPELRPPPAPVAAAPTAPAPTATPTATETAVETVPVPSFAAPMAAQPGEALPVLAEPATSSEPPPVAAAPPPEIGAPQEAAQPAAEALADASIPDSRLSPEPGAALPEPAPQVASIAPNAAPPDDLATALARTAPAATTAAAFDALLVRWKAPPAGVELLSLDAALDGLGERGLDSLALREARIPTLRYFDRPAFVVLRARDGGSRVVLLERLDADAAGVAGLAGREAVSVPLAEFEERWTGEAHVVWRDFESLPALLSLGQRGAPVAWLQHSLGRLGYYELAPTGEFDAPTADAVRAFQASRQLRPDGTVGPLTKMALYDALGRYETPHLRTEERG